MRNEETLNEATKRSRAKISAKLFTFSTEHSQRAIITAHLIHIRGAGAAIIRSLQHLFAHKFVKRRIVISGRAAVHSGAFFIRAPCDDNPRTGNRKSFRRR